MKTKEVGGKKTHHKRRMWRWEEEEEVKIVCTSQIWCVVWLPSRIVLGSHFSAYQLLLSTMAVKSVLCWWCGQSGLMIHVDGRQVIQLNRLAKAGCKCQLYELLFVGFLKVPKVVLPNHCVNTHYTISHPVLPFPISLFICSSQFCLLHFFNHITIVSPPTKHVFIFMSYPAV